MMSTRRLHKNKNIDEYNTLNREIKRNIGQAKARWYEQECAEMEEYERRHYLFHFHKKLKEITDQRSGNNIQELFADERSLTHGLENINEGIPITKEEIKNTTRRAKTRKATDGVYILPDADTLTDEEDLDNDVLLEKVPVTDVAGTFEVHVESSDDDEPIAEPSTSKMKKVVKQKLPLQSWRKANPQYSSSPTSSKFRKVEEIKQQDAFEVALEEEKSNTEQPRITTS
ncbi:hypothetical protein ILUMI_27158 [Ignelater luminosus]|uniref:Uncharacterized protein n=1 Tax=Ignelater luminosus TaxID=2038154 RepID=A0A8K0C5D8_IGNLU|nr:hypothetical protein ILUMI_27158 [Ignelater luminosus]